MHDVGARTLPPWGPGRAQPIFSRSAPERKSLHSSRTPVALPENLVTEEVYKPDSETPKAAEGGSAGQVSGAFEPEASLA